MADDVDVTMERDEAERADRMRASRKPEGPAPTGFCFWCENPVSAISRYCNAECRDEHVEHNRLVALRGKTQRT